MGKGKTMVYLGEDIFYDQTLQFLVCKLHGHGIHPSGDALKRHLRGRGHRSRGQALARVVHALSGLPLASISELRDVQLTKSGSVESAIQPIRYLKVLEGWRCVACEESFLTTSLELIQRHAAAVHGRKRGGAAPWEYCLLQTLFSETKDRRYFRVAEQQEESNFLVSLQEEQEGGQSSQEYEFGSISPVSDDSLPQLGSGVSMAPSSQILRRSDMPRAIILQHPFMNVAEKYVPLPRSRLNFLLKSAAFRTASMPIFDSSSIDATINMQAVFPESEESPVWANALLYSTVQIMNRGIPTTEGQLLQKKTIQLMNKKLSFPDKTLCSAAVGAIMVLKATAYKTYDLIAHDMHTQGLAKVLDYVAKTGSSLTPAARMAIFWLDLNAAAHVGSQRQMSHLDLSPVFWRREIRPEIAPQLPTGFALRRDAFPYGLPECIADLQEFQEQLRDDRAAQIPREKRYARLELMQASIESRLVFQAHACRQAGDLAEAVRLALHICTYCTWMDTWNVGLLPCRLAVRIFDLIESISSQNSLDAEDVLYGQMDFVFWLIFISSSAAELDDGNVEGIRARRSNMLNSVSRRALLLSRYTKITLRLALQEALNNFIYVDGWLERRDSIVPWHQLELDICGDTS